MTSPSDNRLEVRDPAREAAHRLVGAIAARAPAAFRDVLAPDVRLRCLIPSGPGEASGATEVIATFLDWFGDATEIEVLGLAVEPMADRTGLRYRFRLFEEGRWKLVEQASFIDVDDIGRIVALDVLCSGFRPIAEPTESGSTATHKFDAGVLSCADGLAAEFRRRIGAIPIGHTLVVTARDPAAREDLPPLARLMGHRVRSVETPADGCLVITVEKGR